MSIVSLSIGVLAAMTANVLSTGPLRGAVSLIFGLIALLLTARVFDNARGLGLPPIRLSAINPAAREHPLASVRAWHLVYAGAVCAVVFIPAHSKTVFSPWGMIALLSYVRLSAALLLIGVLPGYALLGIATSRWRVQRPFGGTLVAAILLSVCFATTIEWVLLRLNLDLIWHAPIASGCWLIVLLLSVTAGRERLIARGEHGSALLPMDSLILGGIILAYVITGISLNFIDRLLFFDAPVNISGALSLLRANRPLEEDHLLQRIVGLGVWYPSLFRILLAHVFLVSGVPPINAAHVFDLVVLRTVPVLAFYQMARAFGGRMNETMPVVATSIFFLFSGFVELSVIRQGSDFWREIAASVGGGRATGPFSLLHRLSTQNVFIGEFPIYTQLIHAVVPAPLSLTAMLFLLLLAKRGDLPPALLGGLALLATIIATGFHEVEVILLIFVFYPLLLIFFPRLAKPNVTILASLGGLVIIALMDWLAPARFFLSRREFWMALAGTVILAPWAAGVDYIRPFRWMVREVSIQRILPFLAGTGLLLYLALIGLWFRTPVVDQSWVFVPWQSLPLVLGVAGLLALLEITGIWRKEAQVSQEAKFFAASVLALVLAVNIGPRLSYQVHAYRLLLYPFIGISVLAACAVGRFVSWSRSHPRRGWASLLGMTLCTTVWLSGTTGTLLAASYWRTIDAHLPYRVLQQEVGAIDYLRKYRPLHTDVATVNWLSRVAVIYGGAEHNWLADYEPLFGERDPLALLNFLDHRKISSLYITSRDLADLAGLGLDHGTLLRHLTPYLPLAYRDAEVSIYDIPPLAPPALTAPTALVIPASPFLLDAVALGGLQYLAPLPADQRQFGASTIIMDDFLPPAPLLNMARWEKSSMTRVERGEGGAALRFATTARQRTQMWASFRLNTEMPQAEARVCLRYRGEPLPRGAEYYYFELQDAAFRRVFGSTLPLGLPQESRCFPLPRRIRPAWITFAVSSGTAGPMDARLDILSVTFAPTTSWNSASGFTEPDWSRYRAWLLQGGRLYIVGDARGVVADLLSLRATGTAMVDGARRGGSRVRTPPLTIPVLASTDPAVRTRAYYTRRGDDVGPLLFSKTMGKGELFYLALSPYFQALGDAAGTPRGRELFQDLGEVMRALEMGPTRRAPHGDQFYSFSSGVTLTGAVTVASPAPPLVVPGDLQVPVLRVVGQVRVNGMTRPSGLTLRNLVVDSVQVDRSGSSTMTASEVRIVPRGTGEYTAVTLSRPFDWRIQGGGIMLVAYSRGKRLALETDGDLSMEGVRSNGGDLLVPTAHFSSRGEGRFEYARIGWEGPHGGLAWRSWMTLRGTVRFRVDSAGIFLHMRDTTLSGRVETGRVNEWLVGGGYIRQVDMAELPGSYRFVVRNLSRR